LAESSVYLAQMGNIAGFMTGLIAGFVPGRKSMALSSLIFMLMTALTRSWPSTAACERLTGPTRRRFRIFRLAATIPAVIARH